MSDEEMQEMEKYLCNGLSREGQEKNTSMKRGSQRMKYTGRPRKRKPTKGPQILNSPSPRSLKTTLPKTLPKTVCQTKTQ